MIITKKTEIIVICVSMPKNASFSSEFSSRGAAKRRGQKALFDRGAHYIFLATAPTTKQKTSLEKLQI
jgi:hypothetical protein